MDTNTRATTTRNRYCSACHHTMPHRNNTCLACGERRETWPRGPGVAQVDRSNDPWAAA